MVPYTRARDPSRLHIRANDDWTWPNGFAKQFSEPEAFEVTAGSLPDRSLTVTARF